MGEEKLMAKPPAEFLCAPQDDARVPMVSVLCYLVIMSCCSFLRFQTCWSLDSKLWNAVTGNHMGRARAISRQEVAYSKFMHGPSA